MRYTFGQAKVVLAKYLTAYGLADPGATINTALDELSHMKNWQRLCKVVRLTVTSEYFALPQDCGSLRRAAVDRKPVTIHGTDYEFLHSGPGDLDFSTLELAPLHGLQRLGIFPVMYQPDSIGLLAAFSTATSAGALRVRGKDQNGDRVVASVPINVWTGPEAVSDVDVSTIQKTAIRFADIDSVTLPKDASGYISLFCCGEPDRDTTLFNGLQNLARFHPREQVPEFTRYRVPGFRRRAPLGRLAMPYTSVDTDMMPENGETRIRDRYRVLAEVATRFVPLVDEDEVLPFDSLLPVQYMLQSMWCMENNEIANADNFRAHAEAALVKREESELERQDLVVINNLYDISAGHSSNEYQNI